MEVENERSRAMCVSRALCGASMCVSRPMSVRIYVPYQLFPTGKGNGSDGN